MYHVWCENAARPLTQTLQCSRTQVLVLVGTFPGTVKTPQNTKKQHLQPPVLCQQPTRGIHLTRRVIQRFRCDSKGDVESWALGHILNARVVVGEIHLQQCSDTRLGLGHSSEQFADFIFAFYQFWYFCLKSFFFDKEKKIQLVGAGSFSSKRGVWQGHILTSHVWITRDYLFLWQGSTRFTDWIFSNPAALQRHCKCIQWPLGTMSSCLLTSITNQPIIWQ